MLVMADCFSKLIAAAPLKTKTSEETAKKFEEAWIQTYGPPERLHTDQGAEFAGAPFERLLQMKGINKSWTTPYHPQGDGQVERDN